MSSQTIFCILQRISEEYNLPYADLLKISQISQISQMSIDPPKPSKKSKNIEKKHKNKTLQAVIFSDKVYFYDEMANKVYCKDDKYVGMICPHTYELIPCDT